MIVQLFVFAILAMGFGIYALVKKKQMVGVMFLLMGILLLVVGLVVVYVYPHSWPW
ncbi:MAG: hypothetical protein KQI35_06595 [Bacteroidetes bacterium]|nr:hypothetical protein [Bacteroidota bacterium]